MANTFREYLFGLHSSLDERLEEAGFECSAPGRWVRLSNAAINLIEAQERSDGDALAINLGVHYTFLPVAGTEAQLDAKSVAITDCEIKLRLTDDSTRKDQWWSLSSTEPAVVGAVVLDRALRIFEAYRLDGPISSIGVDDVVRENRGLLDGLTRVRTCLLLARIAEHQKHGGLAAEFARLGLELAGPAVGPKKALNDLLKRIKT